MNALYPTPLDKKAIPAVWPWKRRGTCCHFSAGQRSTASRLSTIPGESPLRHQQLMQEADPTFRHESTIAFFPDPLYSVSMERDSSDECTSLRRFSPHWTQHGAIPMTDISSAKPVSAGATHSTQQSAVRKSQNSAPLNFKVSKEFRREFKTYAAQHNLKLNQLLVSAFAALKEKDGK